MRVVAILLAAVLAAGCTGGDDGGTPTPTSAATPTPTADATPTPTNATPTPAANLTPTPVSPTPNATVPVNVTIRHDYANASENVTFTIPPNAEGNLVVTVQFDTAPTLLPGQFVCSPGLKIKVIRPDGSIHVDVTSSAGSGEGTHCGAVSANAGETYPTDVPPGDWHAAFENTGVGIGWVRVGPANP